MLSLRPDGKIQFIAGRNTPGGKKLGDVAEGDGGSMTKARFNGMHELALHPDGKRVFIADTFNHRVRLLDLEAGTVSTFAGTGGKAGLGGDGGPADKAKFDQPYTVALDPAGEKLLIAGVPEKAGTQISSDPLKTQLNRPHGARLDAQGRLWVSDSMNHRVLRFEKLPSID